MADPMNLTPENALNVPLIFARDFYREFVRENMYTPYIGSDEGAIIQVKEDLLRRNGDRVQFAFVNRLVGAGVRGHQVLRGNEEIIGDRYMSIVVDFLRHAVAIDKWTAKKQLLDKMSAAKPGLKNWSLELFRTDIINAFQSMNGLTYGVASPAQRDQWALDNADRVQYGEKMSNTAPTMAASLANLTGVVTPSATNGARPDFGGRMTRRVLSLAKRRAQQAKPRIRPVRQKNGGQEWYVAFLGPAAFRDLYDDPEMRQDLQLGAERGKDNPLFTGGDLVTNGIIVKQEYEFMSFPNGAATPVPVEQNVLCGAQAVGYALAQRFEFTEDTYDYKFEHGIGCEEIRGLDKLRFSRNADPTQQNTNLVDHGVYTIFTAAPNDQ